MPDKNEVISGLMDVRLPYLQGSKAYDAITYAIEFIKGQESVPSGVDADGVPHCGSCGWVQSWGCNYCDNCGKPLRWE